jgi:cell division GTPase FtsZ
LANAPTDNCNWVYIVSSSSERHPFNDIENALRSVGNKLGNDADFIFGHCHRKIPDEKLHPFRVTLVATGICV